MRFMVRYDGDSTAEALKQIGKIVSQSSLVNWLVLEADEPDEARIAHVPGVLDVYQEREGAWCRAQETRLVVAAISHLICIDQISK